ncbi:heme ABC exporter ATP-binding protein CcmA [Bacillus marinisedimentorum]|uniref:heme ABC exporter ATP-binding protein CcmA n=1 Tax=Bacillus marinisedimentorum TaxID=1821260 RepID=UPI000872EECB|nr:heme ABC exporter ATP-binding protein CcmA [Bacillus marinisedimentorum]
MLEVNNMSKMLGDKLILRGLTFSVEQGESVALLGPNGTGKSTAFKCIAGLMKPTDGEVLVDGKTFGKDRIALARKIGYLGHESFLYGKLTPLENLMFYGKLYKMDRLKERAANVLKEVGLHYFRDVPIHSFSRGMTQRLAIARVLLTDPDILLLDEPHTGLDQEAAAFLNEIVAEKRQNGKTIMLVTHDFEHAERICGRFLILNKGKIAGDIKGAESIYGYYREAVGEACLR